MSSSGLRARLFARYYDRLQATYERNLAGRKRDLFAGISGTIVEIGAGTGINLPFYPPGCRYIGVEPNRHMHDALRARGREAGIEPEIQEVDAAGLDVGDGVADVAVSTLVLCTVPDPERTIAAIRRVLRPGGRFLFLEHVAAPRGSGVRLAQWMLSPLWTVFACGCRLNRETGETIRRAGFASVDLEDFQVPSPAPALVRAHVIGCATR